MEGPYFEKVWSMEARISWGAFPSRVIFITSWVISTQMEQPLHQVAYKMTSPRGPFFTGGVGIEMFVTAKSDTVSFHLPGNWTDFMQNPAYQVLKNVLIYMCTSAL